MKGQILVVDDEPSVCDLVSLYLTREGYQVATLPDGRAVLSRVREDNPDLVVLDIMLPGRDGWDLCRQIRRESGVPIIMLTARSDDGDKILGLELGADDYLTKPFNPRELVARIKSVLRRAEGPSARKMGGPWVFGSLEIDAELRVVRRGGQEVPLTLKELELLLCLAATPGKTFTRQELLESVWGYDFFGDDRNIDVYVKRLRAKIEPKEASETFIQTVWGVGYRFERREPR